MMKKILLLTIFTFLFSGCSSTTDIKDWLKEGTREHQENEKKSFKTGKTKLKDYLEKNGCISGSSAKPIETKDKNILLYEVTCVTKSRKLVVKCDENQCAE